MNLRKTDLVSRTILLAVGEGTPPEVGLTYLAFCQA